MEFLHLIAMAGQAGGDQGGGNMVGTLVMFGGVILIMYFMMIRPQQKRQKEHQAMLSAIKKGDKVVTSSGMHGKVVDVDEKTALVEVADNVKIRFEKVAIASKS